MRLLARFLFSLAANAIALYVASSFVPGFHVTTALVPMVSVAAILTALHMFLRPILRVVFTPIIILTLGFGIIALNMLLLALLDFLSSDITITGISALFFATLIVSAVNLIFHFSARGAYAG